MHKDRELLSYSNEPVQENTLEEKAVMSHQLLCQDDNIKTIVNNHQQPGISAKRNQFVALSLIVSISILFLYLVIGNADNGKILLI